MNRLIVKKGDGCLNRVIQFSIKNKLAIWLLTIMVIVAGIYAGTNMKMETLPNINAPVVTITTLYPGASPQEVADKVTSPIERSIRNADGVKTVTSTSAANISSIQVEYDDFGQDMDQAVQDLKAIVDKVSLPDHIEDPEIAKININSFPVISLSVSGENKPLKDLTKAVEDNFVPELEGLDGVHSVEIAGQQVEEVELSWKEDQLKKYGLTPEVFIQAVEQSNLSTPVGLFHIDKKTKSVLIDGKVTTLDDLKKLKIPVIAGGNQSTPPTPSMPQLPQIQLQDVAKLKVVQKSESISRTDGKESIGVQVVKTNDANTVEVVNAIKDKASAFENDHDGYQVDTIFDQGKPIEDSVNTMLQKALLGSLFAVVIILGFLRDIRSTIIAVFSIPLSLLMAILALNVMDITLNIMTLGAMTVAIGRVVDDSIVVIENIYRRLSLPTEKLRGKELIRAATKEMFIPIYSSTIVTIAVFLPLGLVKGPVGELFMPFALTIVCALLASLLVAVTLVPMMSHSFFRKKLERVGSDQKVKASKVAGYYKRVLTWALDHKLITFGTSVLLLIGSLFLVPKIGVSFLPSEEEKMIVVTYSPKPSDTLEDVKKIAEKVDAYFHDERDIEQVQYTVGGENPMDPTANNQALFIVKYREDTANFDKKKEDVLSALRGIADRGEWTVQDTHSAGGNNQLTLFVYGDNIKQIEPAVSKITTLLKDNDHLKEVDSSLAEAYDQYTLQVDHQKLSKYGLTTGQLVPLLAVNGNQPPLTTVENNGKELDVRMARNQSTYKNINELTSKKITTATGQEIALSEVVKVKNEKAATNVMKRNDELYATVSATIDTKDVSKAAMEIQKEIDELKLPDGVNVEFGGVSEQINESFTQLGLAMLAAVGIVYFILVLTFHGGKAPFAILFSLPFAVIGGLVALLISGETISVSALIGALMLIGIVVTNAIVLVDRVIKKEEAGLTTREALIEAGMTRVRPILMTAIATIGALIPLALGMENGGLISKGLGVTVIGGLTSSTLLTLVIVPIVYEWLMRSRNRNKKTEQQA